MPQPEQRDDEDQMAEHLAQIRAERAGDAAPAAADTPAAAPAAEPAAAPAAASEPSPAPEPAEGATAAPAAAATPAEDPAETLRQTEERLQKARSEIGRIDVLNRKHNEDRREIAALREEIETLRKAPSTAAPAAPSETIAKLDALAAKFQTFPEFQELIEGVKASLTQVTEETRTVAKQTAAEAVRPLEQVGREVRARQQVEYEAAFTAARKDFDTTYPNAADVASGDAFKSWIVRQPPQIRHAFDKGTTPQEAMAVMDAYDAHLRRTGQQPIAVAPQPSQPPAGAPAAPAKPAQNNRLARAAGLPSRPSGSQGGMPAEDDFEGSFAYFRQKRLAQQRAAA